MENSTCAIKIELRQIGKQRRMDGDTDAGVDCVCVYALICLSPLREYEERVAM